jgi:pimeloyl-ACP methyl ester carboxylesterase
MFSKQIGGARRADTPHSPPAWLALLELPRAVAELGLFAATLPPLLTLAARGTGQPVLVLPGLLASDRSTAPLRGVLRKLGFDARGWGLGRNRGPRAIGREGERLIVRIEALVAESGSKVSLVGWSLGGVIARIVARRRPDLVRQVVTLGSPFAGGPNSTNAGAIYELVSGTRADDAENIAMMRDMRSPPAVPSSAIFSRGDGVCAWQICRETPARSCESIEVRGSHCGLGVNPAALYAVADRLAQPEDGWTPFAPRGLAVLGFPDAAGE